MINMFDMRQDFMLIFKPSLDNYVCTAVVFTQVADERREIIVTAIGDVALKVYFCSFSPRR